MTNGSYHSATAAGGLAAVTRSIDLKFKIVSEHTEVTGLFAAAGVALLDPGRRAVGPVGGEGGVR